MLNLPAEFVSRSRMALKGEADEFLSCYQRPALKALRVNSLKISPEEFLKISPFSLKKVDWEENGFYVEEEKIGSHPYHAAGLYYSQEPSAMFPASLFGDCRGKRILDLCSAPGGKGTQIAQKMEGEGIIVLNEYVPARAKILSQNVERLGLKNAVVLNEAPERLAEFFPFYFDKILIDAPCSGEGMFRKYPDEAIKNWSGENVLMCAKRQRGILSAAAKMLAADGEMVYSTCTFSPEEDELQTADFLKAHSDFSLVREEKLLPHKIAGEGHYAALLKKIGGDFIPHKGVQRQRNDKDIALYRDFEKEFLTISFNNLFRAGNFLYSLPEGVFDFSSLNALRVGVRLCEFINGRIEPSHSLAMCLLRGEAKNFVSLTAEEAEKYLSGEALPAPSSAKNGWCVAGIGDSPLGLGKISGGIIKNHYPKGLRAR